MASPKQTVAQILGAQLKPINAQSTAEQARLAATTAAVLHALQGGLPAAEATFNNAVQQTDTLAQNAARMLNAASPNAQTQAELQSINAPPEQQAQLARQAQQQFGGQSGVLYTQEGSIPGASLLAQRQSQLGFLAGLPTLAALQSGESARQLRSQANLERQRVTSQAPSLLANLRQQLVENQRADREFRFQKDQAAAAEAARRQEVAWRSQEAALDRAAQQAITPYQLAEIRLEKKKIQAERQAAQPTAIDVYKAQTDRINARTNRKNAVTAGKPTASTDTQAMTPTQRRAARADAYKIISDIKEHRAAGTEVTYDNAVERALADGVPLEIAVPLFNSVFPAQYRVTNHGLVQTGIRGQPSWGKPRKKKRRR